MERDRRDGRTEWAGVGWRCGEGRKAAGEGARRARGRSERGGGSGSGGSELSEGASRVRELESEGSGEGKAIGVAQVREAGGRNAAGESVT